MSLDPFLRFLSAAQASSLTDPMPRLVRRASFASSQVASMIVLRHCVHNGINFVFWKDTTVYTIYSIGFGSVKPVFVHLNWHPSLCHQM